MTFFNGFISGLVILFFLFCLPFFLVAQSKQPVLDVVYPKENQVVQSPDSAFTFGSFTPVNSQVWVNGVPAMVEENGAFLAYIPVTTGKFTFEYLAISGEDTIRLSLPVNVNPQSQSIPADTFAVDTTSLFPQRDLELAPDDEITVAFRGTPGLIASFSIPGLVENVPMKEATEASKIYWGEAVFGEGQALFLPPAQGFYQGRFAVPSGLSHDSLRVHVLLGSTNGHDLQTITPAKITIFPDKSPRIAVLTPRMTVARTGPGLGYELFLPAGVKLQVTGRRAGFYRARISGTQDIWVPESSLAFLAADTPVPYSEIAVVRAEDMDNVIRLKLFLQDKLPFRVRQGNDPARLDIFVYGADSNTDWIRYNMERDYVKELSWQQVENKVYKLSAFLTRSQQWGYDAYYQDSTLVVDIRKPPERYSLKKKLICLDAGHAPQSGSTGPMRTAEKDATLKLVELLKERLEKKGATVFLTRSGQHGANLSVRTKMASYVNADLFLSLHYNALPDGVNPFRSHGTSTYYYHPQSLALAAAIQSEMLKKLKLPSFGLYYDNLSVCRITQMPSVLIEPAFMMYPEEEMLINSTDFRKKTAKAIVEGIEKFLKQAEKSK